MKTIAAIGSHVLAAAATMMIIGCASGSAGSGEPPTAGASINEAATAGPVAAITIRGYIRDTRRIIHNSNGNVEFEIVPALGARIIGMKLVDADWSYFCDSGQLSKPNPGVYIGEYRGYEKSVRMFAEVRFWLLGAATLGSAATTGRKRITESISATQASQRDALLCRRC